MVEVANDGRQNLLRAFKASGCVVCKRRYPELDWSELHADHIANGRERPKGQPLNMQRLNTAAMMAELLRCQVLCTDCHREKHRNGNGVVSDSQMALFVGSGAWSYAS